MTAGLTCRDVEMSAKGFSSSWTKRLWHICCRSSRLLLYSRYPDLLVVL